MVLNPIRFFSGSFVGETIYQNPTYQSPNEVSFVPLLRMFPVDFITAEMTVHSDFCEHWNFGVAVKLNQAVNCK